MLHLCPTLGLNPGQNGPTIPEVLHEIALDAQTYKYRQLLGLRVDPVDPRAEDNHFITLLG